MSFPKILAVLIIATLAIAPLFTANPNPPEEGFNAAGSDPKAIAIADKTMTAMGGREAWDNTCLLYTSPSPRDRG